MSIVIQLASFALKGAAQAAGDLAGISATGAGMDAAVNLLKVRFIDHSSHLTKALERSTARAWRSVEIALAGHSWWDRCKVALASSDARAIRRQVEAYLDANPLDGVDGHGPDFRGQCLAQLHAARKAGLLDKGKCDPADLARRVGDLSRFGDQAGHIDAEMRTAHEINARLRQEGYDALATFLALRPASGPPLLLASMRYFFQLELQKNEALYRGLSYAKLESLAEGQKSGLAGLADALEQHGERLESLLAEVQAVVVETHAAVLDMKSELSRQGRQMQELGAAIFEALKGHQLERRELRGSDSLSIRDEGERRMVRDLIKRYRAIPEGERRAMPAMLNAVGKLEVVSGEYEAAQRDFRQLAQLVPDGPTRAEAAHNAYRAALERRAWPDALASLQEAVKLDPARFAPFPVDKFEPERILGAGGFGVAFLCRNRHSSGRVVIKTLRREGLDRDLSEVFREAQALEVLDHPAIIRIRDCDYADAAKTRPYFVMDYFAGATLADHVERYGPLTPEELLPVARLIAEGLQRAHGKGILHRDVKPANVLIARKAPGGEHAGRMLYEVKLIDFGLALSAATSSPNTQRASLDRTLAGASIAGTLDYAAPEQMGKVKNVAVGPYSDVYGFGKTCCYALFGTAQPTYHHWQRLPRKLADLLGRCLAEPPRDRPQDFGAVLRELPAAQTEEKEERKPRKPRKLVEEALPVMAVGVIPDAEPVAVTEPIPVVEAVEEESKPPAAAKKSGGPLWVATALVVLLTMAAGAAFFLKGVGKAPELSTSSTTPPKEKEDKKGNKNTEGKESKEGKPAFEPIRPDEFAQSLAELKKGDPERRKEVAGRLSVTNPSPAQLEKRKETRRVAVLVNSLAAPQSALDKAKQEDEIWQVSVGLDQLFDMPELEYKKLAAQACQKWGSPKNVEHLLDLLALHSDKANEVRKNAIEALRHIGEEYLWKYLDPKSHLDSKSQKHAIEALGQIGSEKSIPRLCELADRRPPVAGAARAIDQIKARAARKPPG